MLLACHAGCETTAILSAAGLAWADLFADDGRSSSNGDDWMPGGLRAIATYEYTNANGKVIFGVCRAAGKEFRQWQPDDSRPGGRAWSVKGLTLTIYRLPRVRAAIEAGQPVYAVEGEKDVHALEGAGVTATCNPGGAGKWRSHYSKHLQGAEVVIVADNDDPGRRHAREVAEALDGVAASVRLVHAATGKDAADHLAAGHGVGDFVPLEGASEGGVYPPPEPRATVPPQPVEPPAIASDQRILDRLAKTAVALGVVGERAVVATTYLALTSRLLPKQVSEVVKGHSASGKSFTVEQVVRLFPEEAVIVFTAMSQRALIYSDEDFAHRTLIVYEASALREGNDDLTSYLIRSLLSEGKIVYPVTERDDDGRYRTRTIVKEGPSNLILTTTKISVHQENETRLLSLNTDDSATQTAAVLDALAADVDRDVDVSEWVQLQRWLAQHGERRVVIPYAPALAKLVPPVAVRLRRDFGSLLALIQTHAMLHQLNRGRDAQGRIVATIEDYEAVRDLAADILGESAATSVSAATREVVQLVTKLDNPHGVTATVVARELNLDKSAARRRLLKAGQAGYLTNLEDRRARPGRWAPDAPLPDDVPLLPEVDVLRERWQHGGGGVARPRATTATNESACNARDSGLQDPGGGTVARDPDPYKGGPLADLLADLDHQLEDDAGTVTQPTLDTNPDDNLPDGWTQLLYKGPCVSCGKQAKTADPRDRFHHPGCSDPRPVDDQACRTDLEKEH